MQDDDDDHGQATYASPPCFMHEVDPAYMGLGAGPDARQWRDVQRWRRAERERLIAQRLEIDPETRQAHAQSIEIGLDAVLPEIGGKTISTYWPFRGEPDLRPWMQAVVARGGRCALPVVVRKAAPLVFRCWQHGEPLERGVWNIPVPASGAPVLPDIVIAPVVGFDPRCYRLGYGGGFFDRTLAAMPAMPVFVGVGYGGAAIPTIYPQPHDIPMQMVVTEQAVVRPSGTEQRR